MRVDSSPEAGIEWRGVQDARDLVLITESSIFAHVLGSPKPRSRPGRPVKKRPPQNYSPEQKRAIQDAAVECVARGEPLAGWCRVPGRPPLETIMDWAALDESFGTRMATARVNGAHALASECLVIADAWRKDKSPDAHPMAGAPSDDRRLAVWTRLQLLARWFPTLYGERRQLTHEHQHRMVVLNTNAPLPDGSASAPLPRTPAQVTVTEGPAVTLELPAPSAERIADETADDGG